MNDSGYPRGTREKMRNNVAQFSEIFNIKQKLHKKLQTLLDFYLKQRQNLPEAFSYKAGVINKPSFFTVSELP